MKLRTKAYKYPRFATTNYRDLKITLPISTDGHVIRFLVDEESTYLPHTIVEHILNNFNEPTPIVFDIGSNLGLISLTAAKLIAERKGVVYAFEPKQMYYELSSTNIFANRFDNIYLFPKIVGLKNGTIKIPDYDYSKVTDYTRFSILEDLNNKYNIKFSVNSDEKTELEMISLDETNSPHQVAFIHIGMFGMEMDIIQGGQNFLRDHKFPPILINLDLRYIEQKNHNEFITLLTKIGYNVIAISECYILAQHRDNTVISVSA